jgi:hypothetical protein
VLPVNTIFDLDFTPRGEKQFDVGYGPVFATQGAAARKFRGIGTMCTLGNIPEAIIGEWTESADMEAAPGIAFGTPLNMPAAEYEFFDIIPSCVFGGGEPRGIGLQPSGFGIFPKPEPIRLIDVSLSGVHWRVQVCPSNRFNAQNSEPERYQPSALKVFGVSVRGPAWLSQARVDCQKPTAASAMVCSSSLAGKAPLAHMQKATNDEWGQPALGASGAFRLFFETMHGVVIQVILQAAK